MTTTSLSSVLSCCIPGMWQQGDLHRFTLSFKDSKMEQAFAEKRREQLLHTIRSLAMVSMAMLLFNTLMDNRNDVVTCDNIAYEDQPNRCPLVWAQAIYVSAFGGQVVLASAGAYWLVRLTNMKTWIVEGLLAFSISVFLLALPLMTKYYMSRAHSYPYAETIRMWDTCGCSADSGCSNLTPTDGNLLLYIDVCVTALHLMPIRWKWLVPVEIVAVLSYAVPALTLGSPAPKGVTANVVALTALVCLASRGKRWYETTERELFLTILAEKRLRFSAEFQLSQRQEPLRQASDGHKTNAEDGRSQVASYVTGTTGQAFDLRNPDFTLEALARVGQNENWLLSAKEVRLRMSPCLGEGGFGIVAPGVFQGMEVAIKAAKHRVDTSAGEDALWALCNELRILRRLRHRNIVFLYGAVLNPQSGGHSAQLYLVLEYIRGTQLSQFAPGLGLGKGSVRAKLCLDVASALTYLHKQTPPVVHGDLKADNVFVENPSGECCTKLLDFGLARKATPQAQPMGGTLRWMPPEIVKGRSAPDAAADIFSFGRLIFFISTGKLPLADTQRRHLRKVLLRSPAITWPDLPVGEVCWKLKPLVEQCTQKKPDFRPDIRIVRQAIRVIAASLDEDSEFVLPTQTGSDGTLSGMSNDQRTVFSVFDVAQDHDETELSLSFPGIRNSSNQREQLKALPEEAPVTVPVVPVASISQSMSAPSDVDVGSQPVPASEPAEVAGQYRLPQHAGTPFEMRKLSLLSLTSQWNFFVPAGTCCPFHAATASVVGLCEGFAAEPCLHHMYKPIGNGQCNSCGLLFLEDTKVCEFCGESRVQS